MPDQQEASFVGNRYYINCGISVYYRDGRFHYWLEKGDTITVLSEGHILTIHDREWLCVHIEDCMLQTGYIEQDYLNQDEVSRID